jgi:hypothetical protein
MFRGFSKGPYLEGAVDKCSLYLPIPVGHGLEFFILPVTFFRANFKVTILSEINDKLSPIRRFISAGTCVFLFSV